MRPLKLPLIALVLALVACQGAAAPTPQIVYVTAPPQPAPTPIIVYVTPAPTDAATPAPTAGAATPLPTVVPTPEPTAPPTEAPAPSASVRSTETYLVKWTDVLKRQNVQVIQEVENAGTGWAKLVRYGSDLTVFEADGTVATATSISDVAPLYLGPGQTGYFLGAVSGLKPDQVDRVEVAGRFENAEEPSAKYPTSKVKHTLTSYGSPAVTGLVANDSDEEETLFMVVVILFDAGGKPIGWGSTYIQAIAAGATKAFEVTGLPQTGKKAAKVVAFGVPF